MAKGFFKYLDPVYAINKEFIISKATHKNGLEIFRISQNLYSFNISIKELFLDANIILFTSMVNFFQSLNCTISDQYINFYVYTQALNTYCLKLLARRNIIKIISCEKSDSKLDLSAYYYALGNAPRYVDNDMYHIIFCKLRSFNKDDIDFIKQLVRLFKIDENQLNISFLDENLSIKVKTTEFMKSIFNGKTLYRLTHDIPLLSKENETPSNESNILKRSKKS